MKAKTYEKTTLVIVAILWRYKFEKRQETASICRQNNGTI